MTFKMDGIPIPLLLLDDAKPFAETESTIAIFYSIDVICVDELVDLIRQYMMTTIIYNSAGNFYTKMSIEDIQKLMSNRVLKLFKEQLN